MSRVSFIDLNADILQAELSGAGMVMFSLGAARGPAARPTTICRVRAIREITRRS